MSDEEPAVLDVPLWAGPILENRLPSEASTLYASVNEEAELLQDPDRRALILSATNKALFSLEVEARVLGRLGGGRTVEARVRLHAIPISALSSLAWGAEFRSWEGGSTFARDTLVLRLREPLPPWENEITLPHDTDDYGGSRDRQQQAIHGAAVALRELLGHP